MTTFPAQIGPYDVESEIGRGGMGVVYLAADSRLDRKVAIKALPEHFAMDPERLARFEREAKILASLTHANIAAVYGLEEQEGARYLVMEYVEGESLQALMQKGPLAVDEALRIAVQVASGIEAAHDAGVIHRDLKPGNIVVTLQGSAKVLDFGLAKEVEGRGSSLDLSRSPTATIKQTPSHHTAEGQVVGTAAYLSPEQARGKALDKRTDIWAFGCVLYEMLTGASPYAGETMTDSLGAILHKDPEWNLLPPDTPATIQLLLRRCLAKDPNRRLRDIGDARVEIEEALRDPSGTSLNLAGAALAAPSKPTAGSRIGWIVAVIFAAGAAALGAKTLMAPAPEDPRPVRVSIDRGTDERRSQSPAGAEFALSPDGSMLAFCAEGSSTESLLYVRSLDQFEATPLAGTGGATQPFFSPDGRWIGFFANNSLKKVAVSGGAPLTLCNADGGERGGSWGENGMIAFTPDTTTGIWLVSENGGEPTLLTTLAEDERSHRWPHFLPGANAILFVSQKRGSTFDDGYIEAVTVADGVRTVLNHGGTNPKYAHSGHLLFGRAATIYASPFDPGTLEVLAPPAPVLEGVHSRSSDGGVEYAISDSGSLVFGEGTAQQIELALEWADREGNRTRIGDQTFEAVAAALSPQGDRVALQMRSDGTGYDIWIYEIERAALSRLTFTPADEMNPIWSPDGQYVAYSGISGSEPVIFVQRADGGDTARNVIESPGQANFASSWSIDGSHIAFMREGRTSEWDLFTFAMDEEGGEAEEFLVSQFETRYPTFSPDGRWIAYSSVETGRPEVYVRSFPPGGGRWQVSIDGGTRPVWSPDGTELYFAWSGAVYSASVTTEGEDFRSESPKFLFNYRLPGEFFHPLYGIAPDGERFLLLTETSGAVIDEDESLSMILNWHTELNERIGNGR